MKYALVFLLLFWGCGVSRYSASTTASYKTPDGTIVEYTSNKEHEGVVVEIKELAGTKTITIKVESSGTSEAALAAAMQSNAKLTDFLDKLAPAILKPRVYQITADSQVQKIASRQ